MTHLKPLQFGSTLFDCMNFPAFLVIRNTGFLAFLHELNFVASSGAVYIAWQ